MNSKADLSDKFSPMRKISFPRELFVELTLSPKGVKKMRQWVKEGHKVVPMWFASCEKVLFVDWTQFEEWQKR